MREEKKRQAILFILFAGALGYLLGMFLGLLGIVIAMAIVFAIGMHMASTNNNAVVTTAINNRPIRIRYRCLSCYTIHSKRECPKCGSRIKQAEF